MLLDAYLSVEEIERLRDQRLNLLDAQVLVTEQYLTNLTQRLIELEQNASRFKPYSQEPDARDMPENLQLDITQTTASIELYEETLSGTRDRVTTLTETFARDIRRFQELTGLPVAEIN
jgi:phage shock protein A